MVLSVKFMSPERAVTPASSCVLATNGTIDPPSRALWVTVAGTATLTDLDGHSEAGVALGVGIIPCQFTAIASISSATIYILR